jgi:hypothetical protein
MKGTQRFTTEQQARMQETAKLFRTIRAAADDALGSLLTPADEEDYLSIAGDVRDSVKAIRKATSALPAMSEVA